jgi:hypothetical protein
LVRDKGGLFPSVAIFFNRTLERRLNRPIIEREKGLRV